MIARPRDILSGPVWSAPPLPTFRPMGNHTPQQYRPRATVDAMQLTGTEAECFAVAEWAAANGYPWLIGNALEPDTLRERGCESDTTPPARGIYLDPAGGIVLRSQYGDIPVDRGDWVIRGTTGEFFVRSAKQFAEYYESVPAELTPEQRIGAAQLRVMAAQRAAAAAQSDLQEAQRAAGRAATDVQNELDFPRTEEMASFDKFQQACRRNSSNENPL